MIEGLEVQKAMVGAVKGSVAFTDIAGQRFYAEPPDGATLPYASIVALDLAPAVRTQDSEGTDVAVTIHVWGVVDVAVLRIMAAIKGAIHDQEIALDTLENVIGREISQTTRRTDGPAVQGIQRFRFLVHP